LIWSRSASHAHFLIPTGQVNLRFRWRHLGLAQRRHLFLFLVNLSGASTHGIRHISSTASLEPAMPLLRLCAWDKVRAGWRLPWTTAVGSEDTSLSMPVRSVCCNPRKLSAVASAVTQRGYVINESASLAGQTLPSERSVMAFHSGAAQV